MIETWIASGRIVDIALVLIGAEALLLVWLLRRMGHLRQIAPALAGLAAGAGLFMALKVALTGGHDITPFLAFALVAHATELALRLGRS